MALIDPVRAPVTGRGRIIYHVENIIRVACEATAAAMVCVEILLLLTSIIGRALGVALVWTDEIEAVAFMWLAMLGAVIALQRGRHMRMTALVNRLSVRGQRLAATIALGTCALFVLLLLPDAISYAQGQAFISSPALGIPDSWRAGALPVGFGLMSVLCITQLLTHRLRDVALVLAGLALIGALLWLATPLLQTIGNWNLVIFFVVLVAAGVLAGIPIGFVFGIATYSYLACAGGIPLSVMVGRLDDGMNSMILVAVPLFVFLGMLIEMTGMAAAMVDFLASLVGHVRGGLCYVLLGAMYLVSGISGAKAADMAAVAPVLFPEMKRRGIPDGELVSLLAASGAMSETIPPSLVLITIGSVTGVSIAALFTGGLLPALVLAIALAVIARRRSRDDNISLAQRASARQVGRAFLIALPALVVPVLIRGAVMDGFATATEVSTIGIAYAAIVGLLIYRKFNWRRLYPMLVETSSLSGTILFIIGTASCMSWALTQSGFSQMLSLAMGAVPGGKIGFLAVSILVFIALGSVLEGIPAMVLFGPLLFPIARQIGINEVHYAMVAILAMGIGLFSPPFGVGYYAACAIGQINPDAGMKRIWPYMGALLAGLVLVALIPWLSTGFLGVS